MGEGMREEPESGLRLNALERTTSKVISQYIAWKFTDVSIVLRLILYNVL